MVHAIRVLRLLCLAVFVAACAGGAFAQGVTERDRLAAQCIGIEEESIASGLAQGEARAAGEARLTSFRNYLTGRGYGPGGPLAHAMSGIETARQAGRAEGRECLREHRTCSRFCSGDAVCITNCMANASACMPVVRCAAPGVVPP